MTLLNSSLLKPVPWDNMRADGMLLGLALFKLLDFMETATFFPTHEANPLVLWLGLPLWGVLTLFSLIGLYACLRLSARTRLTHLMIWGMITGGLAATVYTVMQNLFWMLFWL